MQPAPQPDRPERRLDALAHASRLSAGRGRAEPVARGRAAAQPADSTSTACSSSATTRRSRGRRRASARRSRRPRAGGRPAGARRCPRGVTAGSSTNATAFAVSTRLAAKSLPVAASTSRGTKPSAWQVARIASWAAGAASRGNRTTASSRSERRDAPAPRTVGAGHERPERPRQARAGAQQRGVERGADERDVDPAVHERGRARVLHRDDRGAPGSAPPTRAASSPTAPAGTSGETPRRSAPVSPRPDPRHHALELLDALDHATRLLEQQRTGWCELHAAGRAHQQLDAERRLERLDALAQRRLRDVQPRRGAAEMQLLGDGHEVAQVPQQVHDAQ